MKIENLEAIYTGGGIYIFSGQVNGEWFVADNFF